VQEHKLDAELAQLVPQANVLWFEHFLISGFVAKDEVKSMHSLHHSPAEGERRCGDQKPGMEAAGKRPQS